jgi:hypothetical protein
VVLGDSCVLETDIGEQTERMGEGVVLWDSCVLEMLNIYDALPKSLLL